MPVYVTRCRLLIWWICLYIINDLFSLSFVQIFFSKKQIILLVQMVSVIKRKRIINQKYPILSDPWKLDGSRIFTRILWRECRLTRHRYIEGTIDPIQGATKKTRASNVNERQCSSFTKDDNSSCSNNREDHLSSANRE